MREERKAGSNAARLPLLKFRRGSKELGWKAERVRLEDAIILVEYISTVRLLRTVVFRAQGRAIHSESGWLPSRVNTDRWRDLPSRNIILVLTDLSL